MLEASSRNLRFPKDKDAKPRIIRYVFVALKFRHSNMEILLKVMQKLVSYGRLSVARYSSSRGQSVQLLLRILLIRESQKFSLGNRTKFSPEAPEFPKGKKRKTSDGRKHNLY